jgi:hypothetical protein
MLDEASDSRAFEAAERLAVSPGIGNSLFVGEFDRLLFTVGLIDDPQGADIGTPERFRLIEERKQARVRINTVARNLPDPFQLVVEKRAELYRVEKLHAHAARAPYRRHMRIGQNIGRGHREMTAYLKRQDIPLPLREELKKYQTALNVLELQHHGVQQMLDQSLGRIRRFLEGEAAE